MLGQVVTTATSHATLIDDEMLSLRVRRALKDIKPLCDLGAPFHIQVNDGVVTLSGVVASYLCKLQIVQTVCGVAGVRQVRDKLWA